MKPFLAIVALFAATVALPWHGMRKMNRAWRRGKKMPSAKCSGAAFALILLRSAGVKDIGVSEGRRLFRETYDPSMRDIRLSRPVFEGRHLAALARAALQAGIALQLRDNDRATLRLLAWNKAARIIVNILPVAALFMLFHPATLHRTPFLVLFLVLLTIINILTYPAVNAAAERAKRVILEHHLLAPDDLTRFHDILADARKSHFATPIYDCFWISWLL